MTDTDTAADQTDPASRRPLSQAAIVEAAVALADAEGVKSLTMRKLASSIGYEVMSLYNHVANKNQLLDLMVDAVTAEVESPPESAEPMAAVRAIAMSWQRALASHPWAPQLCLTQMPGAERLRIMEDLLRFLDRSDLPAEQAHFGFHAVNNHVIGYTIQLVGMDAIADPEQTARDFLDSLAAEDHPFTVAHIHQHLDGHTAPSFELVLDLILDGLAALGAEGSGG